MIFCRDRQSVDDRLDQTERTNCGNQRYSLPRPCGRNTSGNPQKARHRRRRRARPSRAVAQTATSRYVGISEPSDNGSSSQRADLADQIAGLFGTQAILRNVRCPRCVATCRAYFDSSNESSSKPIENVLTFSVACCVGECRDCRRIDAAREQNAKRHIGDEPHPHGVGKQISRSLRGERPLSTRSARYRRSAIVQARDSNNGAF